jgi:adenylyltransferase/sulfurtransferase
MTFKEMRPRKDPACPICGPNATIKELIDYDQFCGITPASAAPAQANGVPDITVAELKRDLDAKRDFDLIDVREPQEYQIAKIPGARLIPLGDLPKRIHELDSSREIVVHCKVGGRSAKAAKLLYDSGFRKIKNVAGGIDAWSHEIDPSVPTY